MAGAPRHEGPVSLTNRCGESKSPYVRSHMDNPTAWQLWSPETLDLAKRLNRLLFVSIGYSACHWCHVMAHESFEHPRIAQLLNEHFVPIKIDREERPDIDRQYMDFLQATNGGGGWPLNVFVTPDLEPVYGGTYWPGPNSERIRMGGAGFEDILKKIALAWKEQESRVRESGKQITRQLREYAQEGSLGGTAANGGVADGEPDSLDLDLLEDSYQHYKHRFDSKYGGFGGAPKFPTPVHLTQLLRLGMYGQEVEEVVGEEECADACGMALKTLTAMSRGGIKDQIGHGFARYSVTRDWSLPHFEKMLYDNAQLLPLYLDAYLLTRDEAYLEAVHDIATYLTSSPMVSEKGGIHASEDADSAPTAHDKTKKEGAYYVWKYDELKLILDERELQVTTRYWGVKPNGNIEKIHDAEGELTGQNTLCVQLSTAELAQEVGSTQAEIEGILNSAGRKMLEYRHTHRPRPALDDKIVTAWNGLAIGGLARTSAALRHIAPEPSKAYLIGAERAAACIRSELFDPSTSTLRRVYREGPGATPGFADDYAFLISGLIDLYEATFDDTHLQWADTLQQTQLRLFWDQDRHAFFSTPADQPDILVRTKDGMDNAEPSTNGVSAWNLYRLASLLADAGYEKKAHQTVAAFDVEIAQHPGLFSGMMCAVVAAKLGFKKLLVVGEGELAELALQKANENVRPHWTLQRVGGAAKSGWLKGRNSELAELDASKEMVQLCEGTKCTLLDRQGVEEAFAKTALKTS